MTDKEIKQNAEAYAEEHAVRIDGGGWEEEYDYEEQEAAYIAGAHSRDEEIKELNNLLEARRESLFQSTKHITELEMENNQLRNPWVSVEDRLPRKLRKKNYSKEVLCKTDEGTLLVSIYNYKKREWTDGIYIKITHWMPIPEVKKGE